MKTEHNGVEITYIEGTDDWHFQLRGRSRAAASLAKAKEAIDKEPADKRKPFPRFEAYLLNYQWFVRVTVTSIAEDRWHPGTTYWVMHGDQRRKEKDTNLYKISAVNEGLLCQIRDKEADQRRINDEVVALRRLMETVAVPEGLE